MPIPRRSLLLASGLLANTLLTGCTNALPRAASAAGRAFDLQAHRGGRALWPENTLAAFEQSLALGVTTLELDIALTVDGVPVVSHDAALNPDHTRDAQGRWLAAPGPTIHTLTRAQLQAYDVGRINPATDYGRQFPRQSPRDGQRIPTLAQLFDSTRTAAGNAPRFNIEPKTDPTQPGTTAALDAMLPAILAEVVRAGVASRITIQSFDWRALQWAARAAPSVARGYLSSPRTLRDPRWTAGLRLEDSSTVPKLVKAAAGGDGTAVWSPAFSDLRQDQVQEAHALGLTVVPWTVNRKEDMARLMDMGVDGLITDDPQLLRTLMGERGLPLPQGAKTSASLRGSSPSSSGS